MEIKTLNDRPNALEEVLALIEKSFDYKDGNFIDDFSPLFAEENKQHFYLLYLKDQLAGTIGVRPCELKYKGLTLETIFLGGICLDEKFRGQKYFSAFFTNVISRYQKEYSLAFLWSDKIDLYKKYGFIQVGTFTEVSHQKQTSESLKFLSEADQEDRNIIKKAYAELSEDFLIPNRNEATWKLFFNHKSIRYKTSRSHYFCIGKGGDLKNIIHEFSQDFHNLSMNGIQWLPTQDPKSNIYSTALMLVLNPDLFIMSLEDQFKSQLSLQLSYDQKVFLKGENGFKADLPLEDFCFGLFGPGFIEEFKKVLGPLFIPGFDSI